MNKRSRIRVRVAVIISKKNKILLVQHQKGERKYWLLPGGGVEFGESIAGALKRELLEECSIAVEPIRPLFLSDAISPDQSRHIINIVFLAKIVSGKIHAEKDNRLKKAKFIEINELDKITLYPNYKKAIKRLFKKNFEVSSEYLGQIWEA